MEKENSNGATGKPRFTWKMAANTVARF